MSMEEQHGYLVQLEMDLNGFETSPEPRERTWMATIRKSLAEVRERIHQRNEWWENEPKLKQLESRLKNLEQTTALTKH